MLRILIRKDMSIAGAAGKKSNQMAEKSEMSMLWFCVLRTSIFRIKNILLFLHSELMVG